MALPGVRGSRGNEGGGEIAIAGGGGKPAPQGAPPEAKGQEGAPPLAGGGEGGRDCDGVGEVQSRRGSVFDDPTPESPGKVPEVRAVGDHAGRLGGTLQSPYGSGRGDDLPVPDRPRANLATDDQVLGALE